MKKIYSAPEASTLMIDGKEVIMEGTTTTMSVSGSSTSDENITGGDAKERDAEETGNSWSEGLW